MPDAPATDAPATEEHLIRVTYSSGTTNTHGEFHVDVLASPANVERQGDNLAVHVQGLHIRLPLALLRGRTIASHQAEKN